MPLNYLLVPDPALSDAIAEQLATAGLGEVRHENDLPDAKSPEMIAIILDEAACDTKRQRKIAAIKCDACVVLTLGAPPASFDAALITENFPKPVRLGHLLARLHFYLEVAPKLRSTPITIGPYQLDAQQRSLRRDDEMIRLTEKETALLEYLAQSPAPVGREELLAGVWGYDARIDTHTLETHVYQLRRKLGGEFILNEGGLYRLAT